MSKSVPEKMFLRGVLLHYINMKKSSAESHRILVEVYGEHALAERTCESGLHDLKVVILTWKAKNVLGSQKSLKTKNGKHYSMKIVAKHKKSSQDLWSHSRSHFKTFKSSRIHSKARKLGFTWTQAERRWKAVLHVRNAAGTPEKEDIFASDCYWWWKMDYELLKPGKTINGER